MPKLPQRPVPAWQTSDGETVRVYQGHAIDVLGRLPPASVQCCVTSPPYWGLRSYNTGKHKAWEIGSEPSPDCGSQGQAQCGKCFVCTMVAVFRGVRRVLRDDGVLWLNLGDSYGGGGSMGGNAGGSLRPSGYKGDKHRTEVIRTASPLPQGNLVGIPWRVALALQADGWVLRSDVPWVKRCLSGGTWLYARTQKGDMPIMLKDLVRLRPETVQLWNGLKWTRVKRFSKTLPVRTGRKRGEFVGYYEIEFRSGERVGCTAEHVWPTHRGNMRADELTVGDIVKQTVIPEPTNAKNPSRLDDEACGYFVGLYLAEGCKTYDGRALAFSGHQNETADRLSKLLPFAESLHCSAHGADREGNGASVIVNGGIAVAIADTYISGTVASNKCLTNKCWMRSNSFLLELLNGYLEGDGHWEEENERWRIGFCNNDSLARDLRLLCARLGVSIRLKRCKHVAVVGDERREFPGWRGSIRMLPDSVKHKNDGEIVAIRPSRSRIYWDIEVEDDPHLFSLASGILTHNSAMPESVGNRPAKALEYVFMLTKSNRYFYDAEAVKKKGKSSWTSAGFLPDSEKDRRLTGGKSAAATASRSNRSTESRDSKEQGRNFRNADLWFESLTEPWGMVRAGDEVVGLDATSQGYAGAHFACFPPGLVEPLIKAGTSAKGACSACGSPWRRVLDVERGQAAEDDGQGNRDRSMRRNRNGIGGSLDGERSMVKTKGWEPTCECEAGTRPCVVLDPFFGSGTVGEVCLGLGLRTWGIELSEAYIRENAVPRIVSALASRPSLARLAGFESKKVEFGRKK